MVGSPLSGQLQILFVRNGKGACKVVWIICETTYLAEGDSESDLSCSPQDLHVCRDSRACTSAAEQIVGHRHSREQPERPAGAARRHSSTVKRNECGAASCESSCIWAAAGGIGRPKPPAHQSASTGEYCNEPSVVNELSLVIVLAEGTTNCLVAFIISSSRLAVQIERSSGH